MRNALALSAVLLASCAGDTFEFRGYAAGSDCDAIVATERSQGAVIGVRTEDVPGMGAAEITEIAVDLFGYPATASIACFEAGIVDVSYVVSGKDPSSFDDLSGRLRDALGPWSEEAGTSGRIRTFRCGVPASVILVEDRADGRAELIVTPRRGVC